MKKLAMSLLALCVLSILTSSAHALPPIFQIWLEEAYAKSPVAELAKEAQCNICHYGASKTARNDYGVALSKVGGTVKNFNALKGDQKKLTLILTAMFRKAEGMKSVRGKTFGELIKAGELPGTPPEGED